MEGAAHTISIPVDDLRMNLMMCMTGEPEQRPCLPEIASLGAGIELGSSGLVGIQSDQHWQARCALHQAICAAFLDTIAIHGPFIGWGEQSNELQGSG